MKTISLDKKSWHYWLAKQVGYDDYKSSDICTYTRYVALGAFAILLMAGMFAGVASILVHTLLGVIFSFMYSTIMFTELGFMGSMLIIAGIVWYVTCEVLEWSSKRPKHEYDNFIAHSYRSWKDKFCARIDFKD